MKHRLYHPGPLATGRAVTVDRERAHYLTRVLRLRAGAEIECFDGSGNAWAATLEDASPGSARLYVGALVNSEPEPDPAIHLVQGMLKGASMDLVVQKATELGVTDVWPVLARRSNVPTDPRRLDNKHAHWTRVTQSAAEQCGAVFLPRVHRIQPFAALLDAVPEAALVLLQPGSPVLPVTLPRRDVCLMVGPEGGFSDDERAAALAAGAVCHGLGRRILRGETVPLAALAALRHGWGWR